MIKHVSADCDAIIAQANPLVKRKFFCYTVKNYKEGCALVCAFTGHRPQHLPWGTREDDARCAALKMKLHQTVLEVYRRGFETFLCGMARGCDQYFAEAVLQLRDSGAAPRSQLIALIPCPSQPDGWPEAEQLRYRALLARCDGAETLESAYSDGCMLRRNREMLRRAQLLITVFDGTRGGTASTIAAARRQEIEIVPIWM